MKKIVLLIAVIILIGIGILGYIFYSKRENYTYIIDNMTAEEIVNECMYYLENDTHSNQTLEDFFSFYKPAVNSVDSERIREMNYFKKDEEPGCDVVKTISVTIPKIQLDGTVDLNKRTWLDHSYVKLIIYDYDKATEIYGLFLEPLSKNMEHIEEIKESSWEARGDIKGSGSFSSGFDKTKFLSVSRENDYFVVEAIDFLGERSHVYRFGEQ